MSSARGRVSYRATVTVVALLSASGVLDAAPLRAESGDWTYMADLGSGETDWASHLAFSVDGTLVFAAVAGDGAVIALDATTGELQWQATADGTSESWIFAHPSGERVIVVSSVGPGVLIAQRDAATGAELSVSTLGDATMQIWPSDVVLSPDGESLYVVGSTVAEGDDPAFATLAVALATGGIRWARQISADGPVHDRANDVTVSADGTAVAVTGTLSGGASGGGRDAMTVVYAAATGNERWRRRYDHAPLRTNGDQGAQVGVFGERARRVYVAVASNYGWTTFSYRGSDGRRLWSVRYEAEWNAAPVSLAVGPNGTNVYLTGTSYGSTSTWATLAYRASDGALVWLRRRSALGHPEELVIGPGGARVYVAGTDEPGMATVGYRAKDGRPVWLRTIGATVQMNALALSPDASRITVGGMDHALNVADTIVWGFDTST